MAAHISDLPEEVLIEIIKNLDGKSVKDAALVCKDWDRVISTTPAIMKKFVFKVDADTFSARNQGINEKFEEIMTLKRHFKVAGITLSKNIDKNQLWDLIERIGEKLIELKLSYRDLVSPRVLFKLLKKLPNLEALTVIHVCIDSCEGRFSKSSLVPVSLRKLKKLAVKGDSIVFQMIEAPALVELEAPDIHTSFNSKFEMKSFENFLKASSKLESLKVNFHLFRRMSPSFPFKLKRLSSSSFAAFHKNIKQFLLSQAETLETLEADLYHTELHEIVLTECKMLKILRTDLDKLEATEDFYKNLTPLPALQEITSKEGFSSDDATRAVLGNCPELLELRCVRDENLPNHLKFVADHNRNLEYLGIFTIRTRNANFQFLKRLTLRVLECEFLLVAFLKANPLIETLHILDLKDRQLYDGNTKELIHNCGLKHVFLDGTENAICKVYRHLKNHGFGTWKTLELCAEWKVQFFSRVHYKQVVFSFSLHPDLILCENLFDNEPISDD